MTNAGPLFEFAPPFDARHLVFWRALGLWPKDVEGQKNYILHNLRKAEVALEALSLTGGELAEKMLQLKRARERFGGWEELRNLKSHDQIEEEIRHRTIMGYSAGLSLLIAYSLVSFKGEADKATLNKIQDMIITHSNNPKEVWPTSYTRHIVETGWKEFKCVAHMWAATIMLDGFWGTDNPRPEDDFIPHFEVTQLIAYAIKFQEFGLKPKDPSTRSKTSFLDPKDIHIFNSDQVSPLALGEFSNFPDEWFKTLVGYDYEVRKTGARSKR